MILSIQDRDVLLRLAYSSINHGLHHGAALPVALDDYATELTVHLATFVTLKRNARLRGCIGTLHASQPLVVDTSRNAYLAAFGDSRFPALTPDEYVDLSVSISVLSRPMPMAFESEEELIAQLVPTVDGLIISDGQRRATFLPSVWEQLPRPTDFLGQLKVKMGLSKENWPSSMTAQRYTVGSFGIDRPGALS